MSGYRLPACGTEIDRSKSIGFTFNGKAYTGFSGDTLASALLANGVRIAGRSFKLHRPRGIVGSGFEETNVLVQLGQGARTTPNVPATLIRLTEGLVAKSVNAWPSVEFDIAAINDRLRGLFAAGFYYKTFMWPNWHWFEGSIRRAAGLGKAPVGIDPDTYEARNRRCEVLVIGGGAAGQAAAREAAALGRSVVLLEAKPISIAEEGIELLADTVALGIYDHNLVLAAEAGRTLHRIRAGEIILAMGGFERSIAFANNDRPGVMLAGSLRNYVERFGAAPGRRGLFFVNNDNAWRAALAVSQAGVGVSAIVDPRGAIDPTIKDAARAAGIEVLVEAQLIAAHGARGVKSAEVRTATGERRIDCDFIGVSGGWNPATQLWTQAGGTLRFDAAAQSFLADVAPSAVRWISQDPPEAAPLWHVAGAQPKISFVDFQTDVSVADVALAARENYRSVEHVKRYTVLGMGVDQGKLGGVLGAGVLAERLGVSPGDVGTPKARPPFAPVALGLLSVDYMGEGFKPRRRLPAHDFHVRRNALFEDFGWDRPSAYPRDGEDLHAAAQREALAVREGVGLLDGSSLGKIIVAGSEAGAFLDRVYIGAPSTLKPGRIRYGLVLNEHGTIVDDGVYARLEDGSYLLSPTSSYAERMVRLLEDLRQCEWLMDVLIQDVTEQWAIWTMAGPRARDVLAAMQPDFDISAAAFPHLRVREGRLGEWPVRIQRVSFSGEVSFEIAVAARQAEAMGEALMAAGAAFGLTPYGIEALEILRLEKGYVDIGVDTDSETQPADIGFGGGIAKKSSDFLGRRALMRPISSAPGRKQLIGLTAENGSTLPPGAHIRAADGTSDGFVTSSLYSPMLQRGVALALLRDGRLRFGESVDVFSLGRTWRATVTDPVVFDPAGERLNG